MTKAEEACSPPASVISGKVVRQHRKRSVRGAPPFWDL